MQTNSDSHELLHTGNLLVAALKRLELVVPSGIVERVLADDYVEICGLDFSPLFRSSNLWASSSYTIPQMRELPYYEIFERSEYFQNQLNGIVQRMLEQQVPILEDPIPEHLVWEKKGPAQWLIKYKCFCGVYHRENGQLAGGLAICDLKPTSVF